MEYAALSPKRAPPLALLLQEDVQILFEVVLLDRIQPVPPSIKSINHAHILHLWFDRFMQYPPFSPHIMIFII